MTQDPQDLWFLNGRVSIRCAANGADAASVTEQWLARGDSPPLHVHEREDEVFHVLEGAVRLRVGDAETTARAGETVVAPRGVPHCFRVESAEARFLVITTRGDFEGMMREVARPAGAGLPPPVEPSPAMIAALTAACARHHIAIVGPPMAG
jgi:quercetin dioxygenase-like cupin family protein